MDDGILADPTAGVKAALSESGTLIYLKGRAQFQPVLARADSTAPAPLIGLANAAGAERPHTARVTAAKPLMKREVIARCSRNLMPDLPSPRLTVPQVRN